MQIKKHFRLLLLRLYQFGWVVGFFVLTTVAGAQPSLSPIISAQLQPYLQDYHMGVYIQSMNSGKVLYQHNAKQLFLPASLQKLLTATAALMYLGPHFHFTTAVYTDKKITAHAVNNIWIKFVGDPLFRHENLQQLLQQLVKSGITTINGNIYLDHGQFGDIPYGAGWFWRDLSYDYTAPVDAIMIDHNAFILKVTANKIVNKLPTFETGLPSGIVTFKNKAKTTRFYSRDCPLMIFSDSQDHFTLSGCVAQQYPHQKRSLAIRDPGFYATVLVQQYLHALGIQFKGQVILTPGHQGKLLLAQHQSLPLTKIVTIMLKNSDDLIADSLLKTLGATYYHSRGTWVNGIKALEKILAPTGINFHTAHVDDGAGLSRYNLLSPAQFGQLLRYIYHQPLLFKNIRAALPVAGVDGTLGGRMRWNYHSRIIRAKTGTMTDVSGLAGYAIYQQQVIAFVIMINDFYQKPHQVHQLQDKICEIISHFLQSSPPQSTKQ